MNSQSYTKTSNNKTKRPLYQLEVEQPQCALTFDSHVLNKYMKEEIDKLRDAMPISNRLISMDRESNLRMAVSFLRVKRFFEGIPETQDEWQTKSQILHILDFFCFVLDSQMRFLYVTESICLHLGLSQFQIIGLPISDFVHPEDYKKIEHWMTKGPVDQMNLSEQIVEETIRFKYRNSSRYRKGFTNNGYKDVLVSFNFIFCNCVEGFRYCKTVYAKATIIDNTEYFPAFHLNKYQFVLRLTYHFKVVFVDYSAIDFLGCYPSELLDQSIYSFIHPDDTQLLADAHRKMLNTDISVISVPVLRLLSRPHQYLHVNLILTKINKESQPYIITCIVEVIGTTPTEASARFLSLLPITSDYVKLEKAAGEHSTIYHPIPLAKTDKRRKSVKKQTKLPVTTPMHIIHPLPQFPRVIPQYPAEPAHQVTIVPQDPFPSSHRLLPDSDAHLPPMPEYTEYWPFEPPTSETYYYLQPL